MSLIEDALRKARKQEAPGPAEELPPSPDPHNLLSTRARSAKPSLLFWVSVLSLTAVVAVALLLVFYIPSNPLPSASPVAAPKSAPPVPPVLAKEPAASSTMLPAPLETAVPASGGRTTEPPEVSETKVVEALPEGAPMTSPEPAQSAPQAEDGLVAEKKPVHPFEHARAEKVSTRSPAPTGAPRTVASDSTGPAMSIESLLQRAYVYSQATDNARALECYDRILLLRPSHFEALLNRGILRTRTGAMEGAKEDLLAAQRVNPADPLVLNALGVLYLKTGDQNQAEETFRKAGDATALINLALFHWERGEHEQVIATLEDAERADPQNPYAPYYLGLFYRGVGNHASAREKLEQARAVARKRGLLDLAETIESLQTGR
jgi:tetratricopeptide (TPR) repeat protein